jgi:hypothetical protein
MTMPVAGVVTCDVAREVCWASAVSVVATTDTGYKEESGRLAPLLDTHGGWHDMVPELSSVGRKLINPQCTRPPGPTTAGEEASRWNTTA